MVHTVMVLLLASLLFTSKGQAEESAAPPVVIELFTSQSCSSCPPADKILGELAQQSNVIALGCHVTYWDHLNWKDTLSLKECTERQRVYSSTSGRKRIFTPEMLVNGHDSFVGSNRSKAFAAIRQNSSVAPIKMERGNNGQELVITLPALEVALNEKVSLTLISFGTEQTQHIPSGENRNKTVSYINPVLSIITLNETWNGKEKLISARAPYTGQQRIGYALLAQTGNTGKIIAAGQIKF